MRAPKKPARWEVIEPRDKTSCLSATGGVLNEEYLLCRSGRRELVRDNLDGTYTVLETEALRDVIRRIAESKTTVVLIEHDMKLVMGVSDRILVLSYGRKLAEGPPDQIRRHPEVIRAYLGGTVQEEEVA